MKCPRKGCSNEAQISRSFGVLPCRQCQLGDGERTRRRYQFATINQLHRVQAQRDHHGEDLLQPYKEGKPNLDFFKAYPDRVVDYGVEKELAKM